MNKTKYENFHKRKITKLRYLKSFEFLPTVKDTGRSETITREAHCSCIKN